MDRLREILHSFKLLILFWKTEDVEKPVQPKPKKPRKKKKDNENGNFGSMYYLGDLLDSLDRYFKAIKFLKKHDFETYNLYKRIGAQVTNNQVWLETGAKHPRFKEFRPAFYMVFFNLHKDNERGDDNCTHELMYFQKIKWCEGLQPTHHDIYKVTLFYTAKTKGIGVLEYYIAVDGNADLTLIKQKQVDWVKSSKNSRKAGIPKTTWSQPSFLKALAKECNEKKEEEKKKAGDNYKDSGWPTTADEMALHLFRITINSCFSSNDGFQINVSDKSNHTATFNINMLRTPYFFKDRKKTVNHNGRTKRIFHIVRVHKRKIHNKEIFIKTHFRGLKKFWWNDFRINIQSPKGELALVGCNATAEIFEDEQLIPKDMLGMAEVGNKIQDYRMTG